MGCGSSVSGLSVTREEDTKEAPKELSLAVKAEQILAAGHLKLLDVPWLLNQPDNYILQRCQDLPSEAFLDGASAAEGLRVPQSIVVLSYGWLTKQHPDPNGHHMLRVRLFLQKIRRVGLFWDYAALPQKGISITLTGVEDIEKTPEEKKIFDAGLGAINLLYGSEHTLVIQLTAMPKDIMAPAGYLENGTPYEDRGWCYFEATISAILKSSFNLFDLGKAEQELFDHHADFVDMSRAATIGRLPPMTPEDMEISLAQLKFTSGADRGMVGKKYAQFFTEAAVKAQELIFVEVSGLGSGWGDKQIGQLCRALPAFKVCHSLALPGHSITDEGMQLLADAFSQMPCLTTVGLGPNGADFSNFGPESLELLQTKAAHLKVLYLPRRLRGCKAATALTAAIERVEFC